MIRLTNAKEKAFLIFSYVQGGHSAIHRLTDMGLLPGEKIKIIHNTGIGPVTIEIKGSKVALGHGIAQKIMVEEVGNEKQ